MMVYPLMLRRANGASTHRLQAFAIVLCILLDLMAGGPGRDARPATPWPPSGAPAANVSEGSD